MGQHGWGSADCGVCGDLDAFVEAGTSGSSGGIIAWISRLFSSDICKQLCLRGQFCL